jgi:hypothetical protein
MKKLTILLLTTTCLFSTMTGFALKKCTDKCTSLKDSKYQACITQCDEATVKIKKDV